MSIKIKELAFVAYAVSDINRARGFYEGWLGLKPGMQIEFAPGKWWIEYDVSGVALALSNAAPETWPRSSSVTLEVADLDGALADAKASGITVTNEIMEFPPCRLFTVKDPDGNEIGLHQRKA
jgi:predicted enzyme related to lactoylglutathione lyase